MRRLFLLSLITLGTFLFPISALASFAPADRETFQCINDQDCPGPAFVTFNSFTNAPNPDAPAGGDERAFFEVKNANSTTTQDGFSDSVAVTEGQRVMFRVYIHNDANPNLMGVENAKAQNTSVMVQLPDGKNTTNNATAYITATNARPLQISDTATVSGTGSFNLVLDRGSINITQRSNDGNGDFVTTGASGLELTDDNNFKVNLGAWPGGFKQHGAITFTAVAHTNNVQTSNLTCSALDVSPLNGNQATYTAKAAQNITVNGYTFSVKGPNGNVVDTNTVNTSNTSWNYNFNQSTPGTYTVSAVVNTPGNTNNTACTRQITVQSAPTTLAASTSTTTPAATTLPNTGIGNVMGLFAGASVLGTAGHFALRRFRQD